MCLPADRALRCGRELPSLREHLEDFAAVSALILEEWHRFTSNNNPSPFPSHVSDPDDSETIHISQGRSWCLDVLHNQAVPILPGPCHQECKEIRLALPSEWGPRFRRLACGRHGRNSWKHAKSAYLTRIRLLKNAVRHFPQMAVWNRTGSIPKPTGNGKSER